MITVNEVKQRGITKTDEEIQAQIDSYDFSALVSEEKAKYTVEIWDKTSPINGVPANVILENRKDIPENGAVYLIKKDGNIITFQPHNPKKAGCEPMTEQEALNMAETEVQNLAETAVKTKVLEEIVNNLSQ